MRQTKAGVSLRLFRFSWAAAIALALTAAPGGTLGAGTPQRRVVVYYANEVTAAAIHSTNYARLLAVLRRSPTPLARTLAADVVEDERYFPAVVKSDIAALARDAGKNGFDLVVFTNTLALQRTYLAERGGSALVARRFATTPPATADPILATSPLARPDYLRSAVRAVDALYAPGTAAVTFVANTHGSADMALMPRVNTDMSIATPAAVLAELGAVDAATPVWAQLKGTNKVAFWQALGAATGLRYDLVFREACTSGLVSWPEFFAVPETVGTIADTALRTIVPSTVDYGRIFDLPANDPQWSRDVAARLAAGGIHIGSRATDWRDVLWIGMGSIPAWLYFVPLAAWLAWLALTWPRTKRAPAPPAWKNPQP